jgi:hypothetical protein
MDLAVKNKTVLSRMEVRKLVINLKCVLSFNKEDVNMERHVLLPTEEQTLDESFVLEMYRLFLKIF